MPSDKIKQTRAVKLESVRRDAGSIGQSWFLGIGIDHYQHFSNLRNAKKDIEDVLALLSARYEVDHYLTLFNEFATRDGIIDALQELQEKVEAEDKLVIYYSGHGYLDKGRGYWLPHDAKNKKLASYLRNSSLKELIEDIPAKHILLISDSCFSGTLTRHIPLQHPVVDEFERDPSRWVIASGRQQEVVADGQAGTNSPFTASLLKVLRKNQETGLNAGLLYDKVSKLTSFAYDQMPQSGPMIGTGHEGGQYVFRLKNNEQLDLETAREKDTITEYSVFLRKYPQSKFAEAVLSRIIELEEEEAWEQASRKDQISGYHRYLRRYPEGRYRETAREAIEKLEMSATETETASKKSQKNMAATFTDLRDGQTYRTVELNGLVWMAGNLNFDIGEGAFLYNDDPAYSETYGLLYTWEAAKKACPPGWRLPTDKEWRDLALAMGGLRDGEETGNAQKAYHALIKGGSTGFNGLLGGYRDSIGDFHGIEEDGKYWTATAGDLGFPWVYGFNHYYHEIFRNIYFEPNACSCRCVRPTWNKDYKVVK